MYLITNGMAELFRLSSIESAKHGQSIALMRDFKLGNLCCLKTNYRKDAETERCVRAILYRLIGTFGIYTMTNQYL